MNQRQENIGSSSQSSRSAQKPARAMTIGISSAQHFWTFDLARQMERLGHLGRLYTGYPQWKVDHMPRAKVRSFPWAMVPAEFSSRLGIHSLHRNLQLFTARCFDNWTARSLEACDVFHCVSLLD